ncbi:hypothetical protein BDV30DRAFT_236731 [Aspergillus minisclerotigenes]|uniref:Uncharacterized protein n=1 Tax=Aspergillus minisclerotigenes TaxID=656917 RepID=A0A5N6JBN7_9EURO|nr:hypothetical protein BDV30DRAFT_236731 [Aspergillus minisclerotigenes]
MTTVRLRSPDGKPVVFEMPDNSTVADLVNRGFQELKIKPMEFANAYMGDQSLPANDLLKEHQPDEGAALEVRLAVPNEILYDSVRSTAALSSDTVFFTPGKGENMPPQTVLMYLLPLMDHVKPSEGAVQNEYITSEGVDELEVNLMFKLQEMTETLEFTGAEPRELPQLTISWLDAIARAGYSAYGECRSRTVIEAYLIPALAIVNTGVDCSNHQPSQVPNLKPQPIAAFSLVPDARLVTSVERVFDSKNKTIYHINGCADWVLGAYDVPTRGIKLLIAIEAKSPNNWGKARGELLLYMATIQNDRMGKGQPLVPVHGFCSDGDMYLFATLHENSQYQFTEPLSAAASHANRCTIFSNMVYMLQQAKATVSKICKLPAWDLTPALSASPSPLRAVEAGGARETSTDTLAYVGPLESADISRKRRREE